MRKGNEKLLNGLKEGVIVIDKAEGKLMFANSSAFKLDQPLKQHLCRTISKSDKKASVPKFDNHGNQKENYSLYDCKVPQFARIDEKFNSNVS